VKLTEILPLEKWVELEKEFNAYSGLDVNVFDAQGRRISDFKFWANRLCPAIKDTDKGQSFICAVAHMNVAAVAKNSRAPVIEECDAGLVKIVVPIFIREEFVGAVGACGVCLDEGEPDAFLIHKITEIDEAKIDDLSSDIGAISSEKANDVVRYILGRLKKAVPGVDVRQE
jgi:ligand-binding sensor protein